MVAQSLSGEKFSREQAGRDPMTYFNLRHRAALLIKYQKLFYVGGCVQL